VSWFLLNLTLRSGPLPPPCVLSLVVRNGNSARPLIFLLFFFGTLALFPPGEKLFPVRLATQREGRPGTARFNSLFFFFSQISPFSFFKALLPFSHLMFAFLLINCVSSICKGGTNGIPFTFPSSVSFPPPSFTLSSFFPSPERAGS